VLFVHHADHLPSLYLECCAGANDCGSRHSQTAYSRERLLADEVAGGAKRDCGFFAVCRNDSEFCAAFLEIEDGVGWISLRKEGLRWF